LVYNGVFDIDSDTGHPIFVCEFQKHWSHRVVGIIRCYIWRDLGVDNWTKELGNAIGKCGRKMRTIRHEIQLHVEHNWQFNKKNIDCTIILQLFCNKYIHFAINIFIDPCIE
jgi:hypothetical protein